MSLAQREQSLDSASKAKLATIGRVASIGGSIFGDTYYVDSGNGNAGDSGRHGLSPLHPFATIDYAIGECTASQGDVILVGPGHTEVVTAGSDIDCDKAGIKILGLGWGSMRPKITFTTATTARIDVDAADVWIENLQFECDKTGADLANMIAVSAANCTIKNCLFTEGTADEQALNCILLDSTAADFCSIIDCRFISETAGAASAINVTEAVNEFALVDCDIQGDYSAGCVVSDSAHLNCRVLHNVMRNDGASDHAVEFTAAATGIIADNRVQTAVTAGGAADVFDIGSCGAAENYAADADADTSGVLTPPAT